LRCLAHFLDDGGAYAKEILDGDIHTTNQKAAGLDTRDQAKTFIYALLYGAGDAKIGSIIDKGAKEGKLLKERFMEALPAFRTLKKAVEQASKRGFIKGLDGRQVKVRSAHAALNTLLQSAGGLICKKWLCLVDQEIKAQGIDAQIIAWVHDELQISVKKGSEQDVCNIARRSAEKAGESFGFRIPVGADATIGGTWADTH
jgi:DNA polymerase I-like protein with 3'-5' exonuclease and polymerase domains